MRISKIFAPHNAHIFLITAVLVIYVMVPLIVDIFLLPDPFLRKLWILGLISILGIYFGSISFKYSSGILSYIRNKDNAYLSLRRSNYQLSLICVFVFLCVYLILISTSAGLPIFSAITGSVDSNLLSFERGAFLKQRSGAMSAISYLFSVLIASIMPFALVVFFDIKSKFRFLLLFLLLFVSVSFLVKAMFLNFFLPLTSYFIAKRPVNNKTFIAFLALPIIFLYLMTSISGYKEQDNQDVGDFSDYVSASYSSSSTFDFLLWRSVVIPVVVARDTLIVHEEQFQNIPALGATSGFIALITGRDRVDMERLVFEYQYGGWNEIGNSNTTFIIDAYVNFGSFGVFIFSFIASLIIRYLGKETSLPMASMAILFAFFLISSSLIGIILSNGFFLLLFWRWFQRKRKKDQKLIYPISSTRS